MKAKRSLGGQLPSLATGTILTLAAWSSLACGKKASTAAESAKYSLTLRASAFEAHNDAGVKAVLTESGDDGSLSNVGTVKSQVSNGQVEFSFTSALVEGKRYFVDYYVDMNGNASCDNPPIDHVWRLNLPPVKADLNLEDKHRMSFSVTCADANRKEGEIEKFEEDQIFTTDGKLELASGVSDATSLRVGDPVAGATVFVEGYPNYQATSDVDGNFSLKIPVSGQSALKLAESHRLVMWYTELAAGAKAGEWNPAAKRYGAAQDLAPGEITAGGSHHGNNIALTYTTSAILHVESAADATALEACWVRLPAYDFLLNIQNAGGGNYRIDYLPAGEYEVKVTCAGYEEGTKTFSVSTAKAAGASSTLGTLKLFESAAKLKP